MQSMADRQTQGRRNILTIPTPEEAARFILELFAKHDCRVGDALKKGDIIMSFYDRGWHTSHANEGIAYGVGRDWVKDEPTILRLMTVGLAKANEPDRPFRAP
jgi:hypothetical protein